MSQINALVSGVGTETGMKSRILSAIQNASAKSGVEFAYLLNKAEQESGLDPTAKAKTSSATGLYQFIDQTWLKTVKESGDQYGLGEQARKISIGSDGVARVASEADKKAILDLRNDPVVAASMAAEFAKSNKQQLQTEVGGKIGSTELYLAHFLGAGGAGEFLNTMKANPDAKAADILPQAAAANKNVFFDKLTGAAKSLKEIYQHFAEKFEKSPATDSLLKTKLASAESAARNVFAPSQYGATSTTQGTAPAQNSGTVSVANGVTLDRTAASPFATMVLAQMDMETFGLDAMTHMERSSNTDDEARRKSLLSTLADAA